ncbi:hypothetical protein PPYR_01213 [Photinus pyralis]|uniref:C-CAP/cofactor C-like domain-containing protein n=1 Tax=Photinus pyralis TaxID=7054 RepID=A0A5N4B3X6_PHOPY|nr:hypothetical protein PPYR_01213 [Photinus pyralis]
MENNNTDELCVPGDIEEAAKRATFELLPKKSAQQYDIAYSNFLSWCRIKKVEGNFNEPVFLAYLEEKSKIWNWSTSWSKFSMIKASALVKNGVDVSKYFKVIAFLKRKNEGYSPKKSKTLTFEQDMIANGQEINKSVNSNLLQSSLNSQGINISNCSNCTIHINVHKL